MKWYKKNSRILTKIVIIVFIVLDVIWSIGNDKAFFYWNGQYNPHSKVFYCVMKVIYFFFIAGIGYCFFQVTQRPKYYIAVFKEWIRYGWPVLLVYSLLLVLLWPGNWGAVGDEIQVYLSVKNLRVWPDQGIMSSLFMILCLMIYPSPGIICLVQCIISVALVGITLKKINYELRCSTCGQIIFSLFFITPPVLCFLLCPIRVWLYSVFLIALVENLYVLMKLEGQSKTEQKRLLCVITILCALVANYRSEGMIFIIVCPLVIILFSELSLSKFKTVLVQLIFLVVVTIALKGLNTLGNGQTLRQHSGLPFVTTLSMVISNEEKYSRLDQEDIKNIDAVFDVEVLKEHPSMSAPFDGTRAERTFPEPTKEQMSAYMKSAIKIILDNIPVFFECKWEAAKWSMGVYPYCRTVGTIWTQENIDLWNANTDLPGNVADDFRRYENSTIREYISKIIVSSFHIYSIDSFYIFYAFWLPCLLSPIMVAVNILRKDWKEAFMCAVFSLQLIVVILMAPGRFQMYYLPFYLVGWFEFIRTSLKCLKPAISKREMAEKE